MTEGLAVISDFIQNFHEVIHGHSPRGKACWTGDNGNPLILQSFVVNLRMITFVSDFLIEFSMI